jgi:hypothetical protein
VGGQGQALTALLPGKTRYPLYRRLGGSQSRSGRVRKISPPVEFDPRTIQPVASRYTDPAIPTHPVEEGMKEILKLATKITNHLDICLERLSKTTKIHSKSIRYNSVYDTIKSSSRPSPVDSARITPVTSQQEKVFIRHVRPMYISIHLARQPPMIKASSFTRFLDHTRRGIIVGWTPLDV